MRVVVRVVVVLVGLLVVMVGTVFALSERRLDARFQVPPWWGKAPAASPEVLEKGRHVAAVRGCLDCHRADASGGLFADAMPVMRLVPRNISPGGVTAKYSDADWERAVRHCVRPDGSAIPFMPCLDNAHLADEDLGPLITFLRSLPAVNQATEPTTIGPVGRALFLAGQLPYQHAELIDHRAPRKPAPAVGPTAAYGAYLGETCTGCHGEHMSGGKIPGVPPEWPAAANLTPDESGLKTWTQAQFLAVLKTGVRPDGRKIDPQYMPWKQFAQLTETETTALWLHLQQLAPRTHGSR